MSAFRLGYRDWHVSSHIDSASDDLPALQLVLQEPLIKDIPLSRLDDKQDDRIRTAVRSERVSKRFCNPM
jgi:hypothetical protein